MFNSQSNKRLTKHCSLQNRPIQWVKISIISIILLWVLNSLNKSWYNVTVSDHLLRTTCQWSISCTEYSVFKTDQRQVVLDKEQHISFFRSQPVTSVCEHALRPAEQTLTSNGRWWRRQVAFRNMCDIGVQVVVFTPPIARCWIPAAVNWSYGDESIDLHLHGGLLLKLERYAVCVYRVWTVNARFEALMYACWKQS